MPIPLAPQPVNKCYITCMASDAPTVSGASNAQGTQDHIKFTAYFETACLPQTWIAIGLGEVRRKDERFTHAVPLWSRQWTSRCRRPRKLFYIDFLPNFSRHDLPSASRRRKMLPCTKGEVEALFYFISNLYLTLYPIRTLSIPFPNFTAVHGVGVTQSKPARKHTIATRKCYQYNTIPTACNRK